MVYNPDYAELGENGLGAELISSHMYLLRFRLLSILNFVIWTMATYGLMLYFTATMLQPSLYSRLLLNIFFLEVLFC